jgi:hypothetical protein
VLIVGTLKDTAVATISAGMDSDGAAYDPFSKLVFVTKHDGRDATLIDPIARNAVATIALGERLEFPATDGAGKICLCSMNHSTGCWRSNQCSMGPF